MSGIVGLLNLDGEPVDGFLLKKLTEAMAFRGPDAQEIWIDGGVGFGHAMFRTTHEAEQECQPANLDGRVWITADARVDARLKLIEELKSKGDSRLTPPSNRTNDSELILHAYALWGEGCTEHLLGDFAFAIWDSRKRLLFCARDHFGVKPFFYARVGNSLVFSNTLNCLRIHPKISSKLNDLAIGDFLLVGSNWDPATTTFADIQRLPAAHTLTVSDGKLNLHPYWTFPIEQPIEYQRQSDYVEHFRELLNVAVSDRLRTKELSAFMSGGLDSSMVAATAHNMLTKQSSPVALDAHCVVYDRLIPDRERYYSTLVAEALGIPIHHLVADSYPLYERGEDPDIAGPEPGDSSLRTLEIDSYRHIAAHSRVALTGEGGDPGLSMSMSSHILRQAKKLRLTRLATDFGRYLLVEGRFSRLYVRERMKILSGKILTETSYPLWLNQEFEARWNLQARWYEINLQPTSEHPSRPEAYGGLVSSVWPLLFETCDAGATRSPVEVRHPLFDLRVMRFLLSLPALPWCADKTLFREAMKGILPERVRLRRKTALAGDPVGELLKEPESRWVDDFKPDPGLGRYVDRNRVPAVVDDNNYQRRWANLRPISLNFWLQSAK